MHLGNLLMQSSALVMAMTILMVSPVYRADKVERRRARTCLKVEIPNAEIRSENRRSRFRIMRVNCQPGYVLYGSNYILCNMGKWNAALPVCAKGGCKNLESPPNGEINYSQNHQAHLYCRAGYKLAGGRVTYCNGTAWDRPLGTCRESTDKIQLWCDFETEDLCGWSHDETHNFDWKRIMAGNVFSNLRTGPQHDHTTLTANSGHYMLMESFDQVSASVARLVSPIYPKNLTANSACFKFFYFMYGATVGNLSVYVRPMSVSGDSLLQPNNQIKATYLRFQKSGNQKNIWTEGQFTIEEMSEDFQIIIEGTTGTNHLSDIAIDDVHLMTYPECFGEQTSSSTTESEATEYAIFDIQSCEGRCGETNITHYGLTKLNGRLYKNCDCHSDCEDLKTCCPNYQAVCELGVSESSTEIFDAGTVPSAVKNFSGTSASTLAVTKPTTTSTTASTTTSTSTTTTTTTSTTTTPKPITTSTTTTPAITRPTTLSTSTSTKTPTTVQQRTTQPSTTPTTTTRTRKASTVEPSILPATLAESPNPMATSKSPEPTRATPPPPEEKIGDQPEVLTVASNPAQRERIISWEVSHDGQPASSSPSWLIFISTIIGVAVIATIGVAVRFHRRCRGLQIYKRGSTSDDTATLLYSQDDELIVVS